MSKIGIDVSHHDGALDWDKIQSEIDFAIVRVGYGDNITSQDDKYWSRNIEAVERLGIPHGVYIYSYAQTTAKAKNEAEHVLRLIKGRTLQMPVYFDAEKDCKLSAVQELFSAFASVIRNAGYRCGIYVGQSYASKVSDYDSLWVPRYGDNTGTISGSKKPNTSANYDLWQYTSNAGKLFSGTTRSALDVSVMISEKALSVTETKTETEAEANTDAVSKAVEWIKGIASDDSHGYSQKNRDGNPDYDCSSLVCEACEHAGIPVKSKGGATYTGNMYKGFTSQGFADITNSVNLNSGAGLKVGDVLLTPGSHTAMYVGDGQLTEASIGENGGITGTTSGDQTEREIWTHSYYNYPWSYVLRYPHDGTADTTKGDLPSDTLTLVYNVMKGLYGTGTVRKSILGDRWSEAQAFINHIYNSSVETLSTEVWAGKYGSGDVRKVVLGDRYEEVRAIVNGKKSNETIAKEVIEGKWGNYPERKTKLEAAGYDYEAIRKLVNQYYNK